MGDFTMPSLGADMEAGKVVQWLVKPGDEVHRGDIVAVVETEKSTIEVEIFENGTIEELVAPEGERVPVGAVLAHVAPGVAAKAPGAAPLAGETARRSRPPAPAQVPTPPGEVGAPATPPMPVRALPPLPAPGHPLVESPLVRRLAEHLGVDLATTRGSGPGGSVTRADVERAAPPRAAEAVERPAPGRHPRSSPFARRLADELGVDLSAVSGSGPRGSVIAEDVRRAGVTAGPEAPTAAPSAADDRQRAMQRAIGALMARSKREVPHYYLSTTIDASAAVEWLERANLERSVADRLIFSVLLFKATARAIERVPEMNGFYIDGEFAPSTAVHLGVAISQRSGGLIAPAIHDVERLTIDELMARVKDLVKRARAGVLRSSEMSDPTITVTNLGDLGVDAVYGVIYPPQVALVGFGRVREQPWAKNGMLDVRPCVVATLSADHRVSDGMSGAHYLSEVDRLLQRPEEL